MNYIIFDIEATCWQGRPPDKVIETIEIGAYMIDDYGDVKDKFSKIIKPVVSHSLSAFCIDLTSITQQMVDRAAKFPEVIEEFQDWIGVGYEDYILCSWGAFDKKQLAADCKLHRIDSEWLAPFADLKEQYKKMKRMNFAPGLFKVVEMENYNFDGPHHRAIADAYNLAKIFTRYLGDWDLNR
jgi:inhibitor of KinA sporulation pathway (predicted exonuclease)